MSGAIGHRSGRIDSIEQVTGRALYADDLELPRTLAAKILRSPHAHARILSIDTSAAEALPGVAAVLTGADLPTPYGILPWTRDEQAMTAELARYVGDAVAAVAAVDEETAERACAAIEISWEPLEALLDPEEAAAREDVLLHPEGKRPSNITKDVRLDFGEVDEAVAGADLVLENSYEFHGTSHAAIEPHCALASAEPGGLLTVWSSTQVPHYLHRTLAAVLGRLANTIRVIQPAVGGGFGGKSEPFDLELCVAALAVRTGRPVKLRYSREEVFLAHRGRHPMRIHARTAFAADGTLRSHEADLLLDGGAYASFGLVTTYYAGQLATLPYDVPAYRYHSRRAYTNKPACGPKRGHGSVQPRFALECQIDRAAVALGHDPITVRRRAFIGEHTRSINELRVGSLGLLACLDAVEEASGWRERRGQLARGHGLGVACSAYICGTNYPIYPNEMPQSAVQLCADRSGRVRIFSGVSDIGQGARTMLATVVAEELGVGLGEVCVVAGDTDLTPVDLGAYSSRTTLMAGWAALKAARDVAGTVREAAAATWDVKKREVVLADGRATCSSDPTLSVPLVEAFEWAEARSGTLGAVGYYNTPKEGVHGSYRGATIGATPAFSVTAHVAEVRVDEGTGQVEVVKAWCAHDCGKALARMLVEGQIEGSTYMGIAEALMEHHRVDAGGRLARDRVHGALARERQRRAHGPDGLAVRREHEVVHRAAVGAQQARKDARAVSPAPSGSQAEQRLHLGEGTRSHLTANPEEPVVKAAGARGEVAGQERRPVMPRRGRRRGDQQHVRSRR